MVLLAPLPGLTVSEVGLADNEKSGGAVTTKLTLAVWVKLPLVLVIVRVPGAVAQPGVTLTYRNDNQFSVASAGCQLLGKALA